MDKDIRDQLDVRGSALTFEIAGSNRTKEMASDKLRSKVDTRNLSEPVIFRVHPSMYLNKKYCDYKDFKRKNI